MKGVNIVNSMRLNIQGYYEVIVGNKLFTIDGIMIAIALRDETYNMENLDSDIRRRNIISMTNLILTTNIT